MCDGRAVPLVCRLRLSTSLPSHKRQARITVSPATTPRSAGSSARPAAGPARRGPSPPAGGGPAEQDRRPDAAVVRGLFRFRGVAVGVGLLYPAVVGEEEDDGVVCQSLLIEVVEQLAAGLVEPLHHAPVLRDLQCRGLVLVM